MTQIEILKWSNRLGAALLIIGIILWSSPAISSILVLSGLVLFSSTALLLTFIRIKKGGND